MTLGHNHNAALEALIIGSSPATCRLREMIRRVARSNASVMLCGPSGSGKELVARAIHDERSEERRVGKEWVSTCRSRWSPYHSKKNKASKNNVDTNKNMNVAKPTHKKTIETTVNTYQR